MGRPRITLTLHPGYTELKRRRLPAQFGVYKKGPAGCGAENRGISLDRSASSGAGSVGGSDLGGSRCFAVIVIVPYESTILGWYAISIRDVYLGENPWCRFRVATQDLTFVRLSWFLSFGSCVCLESDRRLALADVPREVPLGIDRSRAALQ